MLSEKPFLATTVRWNCRATAHRGMSLWPIAPPRTSRSVSTRKPSRTPKKPPACLPSTRCEHTTVLGPLELILVPDNINSCCYSHSSSAFTAHHHRNRQLGCFGVPIYFRPALAPGSSAYVREIATLRTACEQMYRYARYLVQVLCIRTKCGQNHKLT